MIVKSENAADAKIDATEALRSEFGRIARTIGKASRSFGPDAVCDSPVKNCFSNGEQWAWFGFSK